MMHIRLPWPPASLSGHNTGHWRAKSNVVRSHRDIAATLTAQIGGTVPDKGDIPVAVTFFPPDNRSDKINLWNRCKPYFDGIADALMVNDSRFVPAGYYIGPVVKNGAVLIVVGQ